MSDKLKKVEILFKREEKNKWKYRWRNESQSGGKCGNWRNNELMLES